MKKLRVSIDKNTHEIYESLVKRGGDNPDDFPFQSMKDLFIASACLGVQHDCYEELTSSLVIFNADVFDEASDIPVMACIAYHRNKDLKDLNDSKKILEITQEYANGGIHLLRDHLVNNPGRPLDNLVELIMG